MAKTITIRVDDRVYEIFQKAANGERRSISNFIENAALAYITNEQFVSDEEMEDIRTDKKLLQNLKKGIEDIEKGRYKIVR